MHHRLLPPLQLLQLPLPLILLFLLPLTLLLSLEFFLAEAFFSEAALAVFFDAGLPFFFLLLLFEDLAFAGFDFGLLVVVVLPFEGGELAAANIDLHTRIDHLTQPLANVLLHISVLPNSHDLLYLLLPLIDRPRHSTLMPLHRHYHPLILALLLHHITKMAMLDLTIYLLPPLLILPLQLQPKPTTHPPQHLLQLPQIHTPTNPLQHSLLHPPNLPLYFPKKALHRLL